MMNLIKRRRQSRTELTTTWFDELFSVSKDKRPKLVSYSKNGDGIANSV